MQPDNRYPMFNEFHYRWDFVYDSGFYFHSHPQYEIYFFQKGHCDYMLGDRIISLEPGDLIIMNGMTPHCPKVYSKDEYMRSMILFDPVLMQLTQHFKSFNPLKPFELLRNYHLRPSESEREARGVRYD